MMQFDLLSRRVTTNTKLDRKCDAYGRAASFVLRRFICGFGALWAVSDSEILAAAIYFLDSRFALRGVGIQSSVTPRTCVFLAISLPPLDPEDAKASGLCDIFSQHPLSCTAFETLHPYSLRASLPK
jgi:hypothetical protein